MAEAECYSGRAEGNFFGEYPEKYPENSVS